MNILRTATVFLLLGTLASAPVSAIGTGDQALGADLGDFDRWELVCPAGTGARAKVEDRTAENLPGAPNDNVAALMEVLIWEFGVAGYGIAAGEGATSGWATASGGSGTYSVRFEKSAAGAESYRGWAECIGPAQMSFSKEDDN